MMPKPEPRDNRRGAIAGATAASQPGYYWAQGNCYYRYPNGQYVQADPRACY